MDFKRIGVVAGIGLGLAMCGAAAQASTTLTYTGNPFTSVPISDFGTSLDAVIITDDTLAPNFTGSLDDTDIASITLTAVGGTVAPVSISSPTTFAGEIDLTNGQVTSWSFNLANADGVEFITELNPLAEDSVFNELNLALPIGQNYNFGPQGTWVVQSGTAGVPEPATWAMMLIGFGGLGATLRSRRRIVVATA